MKAPSDTEIQNIFDNMHVHKGKYWTNTNLKCLE